MNDLVYPRERTLGTLTLILGLLIWLALIVGTVGGALLGLALGFVLYLFAQSALISHIKGNGVELTPTQFPALHAQFLACCERLQLPVRPQAYILHGGGALNAFATRFLGRQFVVLLSGVVDAMDEHPDGVRFYIGHELGHLRRKHLNGHLFRWPALWLPLLGAAYSRARESTCDRHGLACSTTPDNAARALAALSAGAQRWKSLDIAAYLDQTRQTSGFWMSFHELTAGYPWLTKRVARVMITDAEMPRRHRLAYLPALFIPYAGRLGAGFGFLILVYIVAVLAAVALPAYNDYKIRAEVSTAVLETQGARDALRRHYLTEKAVPDSLASAGVPIRLADGTSLSLSTKNMALTVTTAHASVVFTPRVDDQGDVFWVCTAGEGTKSAQLPASCGGAAEKK